jgi:hypothetical protein
MRKYIVLLLLIVGCSSIVPTAVRNPTDACTTADQNYLIWKAIGVASSGLAGATGSGGVLTATLADEPAADISLAASSAVFGILATVAGILSGEYATRAADACQEQPTP